MKRTWLRQRESALLLMGPVGAAAMLLIKTRLRPDVLRTAMCQCAAVLTLACTSASFAAEDGQWTMPGQGLRLHALQRAGEITPGNAKRLHPGLDVLDRRARRARGAAARRQEHDVRRDAVARTCCMRSTSPRKAIRSRWKYRPDGQPERDRHLLLRHRSIAAPSTPTARSSTTCSTDTPWRWTPKRATRCGRPRLRDMRRRRDHADGAVRREGSRHRRRVRRRVRDLRMDEGSRSQDRQDRLDRRATSAPTPTCWSSPAPSSRSTTRATDLGPDELAEGRVEDRRRAGVGLDVLRP